MDTLSGLIDALPDAVVGVDSVGVIVVANRHAGRLFGYDGLELIGQSIEVLVPARARMATRRLLAGFMADPRSRPMGDGCDLRARRRDGREFPVEISVAPVRRPAGLMAVATIVDISDRKRTERQLLRAVRRHAALATLAEAALEGAEQGTLLRRAAEGARQALRVEYAGVFEHAPDGEQMILRVAAGWPDALVGELLARLRDADEPRPQLCDLADDAAQTGTASWIRPSGRRLGVLAVHSVRPRTFSEVERRFLDALAYVLARAIAHREQEERLRDQVLHDPLTGLANRALFFERLEHWLAGAPRLQERAAVIFLDLDDFKRINDSFGHEAGDQVLRLVAQRLKGTLRGSTTLARFGGDEFAVLLEGVRSDREPVVVAARITRALREPIQLGERARVLTACMGISLTGPRAPTADAIVRNADTALDEAKRAGGARTRIFDRRMHASIARRLQVESLLRAAVADGEFTVLYQPIVALEDNRLAGFETLARWRRDGELRSAASFMAIAEDTGLIVPLGLTVLQMACTQAARWGDQFRDHPAARVSVNVSRRQLATPGLVEQVSRTLAETGLEPSRLSLEVSEAVLVEDLELACEALVGLRRLGVRLTLDDFGSGDASLSQLRRLPIDTVKIDRAYVEGVDRLPDRRALVSGVVAVAAGLKLAAIAEGVERAAERDAVQTAGCRFAQGRYFAPPLRPAAAVRAFSGVPLAP